VYPWLVDIHTIYPLLNLKNIFKTMACIKYNIVLIVVFMPEFTVGTVLAQPLLLTISKLRMGDE